MISAKEAIKKLEEGNKKYLTENTGSGDISPAARLRTCANGQQPYAIVIACSDSRVIPESIFSAGIGDLFTIRVAGNVIDSHQLGSIDTPAAAQWILRSIMTRQGLSNALRMRSGKQSEMRPILTALHA